MGVRGAAHGCGLPAGVVRAAQPRAAARRSEVLRRPIANVGAALQHIEAAAEQVNEIDRWGCRRRYIGDRMPPVIGPSRTAMGPPATGSPPDLG